MQMVSRWKIIPTMNKINFCAAVENKELVIYVYIDGVLVKWNVVDPVSFFMDIYNKGLNVPAYGDAKTRDYFYNLKISTFEPFTCGCGVSGCAGIWTGIMTKHRKHTVEWRCDVKEGYHFLKPFYSFNRIQYHDAIYELYLQLLGLMETEYVIDQYTSDYEMPVKEYLLGYFNWHITEIIYKNGNNYGHYRKSKQFFRPTKRNRKRIRR